MENVSEVKLAKFEIMLKETCYWFYTSPNSRNIIGMIKSTGYAIMPFCLPIIDNRKVNNYLKNPYIKQIYDVCFSPDSEITGPQVSELGQVMSNLKKDEFCACYTLMSSLYSGKSRDKIGYESYKIRGGMIFWALLLAAIDESFYNNEISMVSDLAYMLDFTEDMMSDWVAAVKYLLDGNRFSENISLEFKTPEANLFFKHRKNEGKHQTTEIDLIESLGALNG